MSKENFIFNEEIEVEKRKYKLTYTKDLLYVPVNLSMSAQLLWIEDYSKNKKSSTKIKGYLKTNVILKPTTYPFGAETNEYFYVEIHRKNKYIDKHTLDGVHANLSESNRTGRTLKTTIKDNIQQNGTLMHYWSDTMDGGLCFNFYLGNDVFNDLLDALLTNSFHIANFQFFIPNLYELTKTKHRFEYGYRFFDGDYNKGVIHQIQILRNISDKKIFQEQIYGSLKYLETFQRMHPITRKVEASFLGHEIFQFIRAILSLLFGWLDYKDHMQAIRHLLVLVVLLLFIIMIKLH